MICASRENAYETLTQAIHHDPAVITPCATSPCSDFYGQPHGSRLRMHSAIPEGLGEIDNGAIFSLSISYSFIQVWSLIVPCIHFVLEGFLPLALSVFLSKLQKTPAVFQCWFTTRDRVKVEPY